MHTTSPAPTSGVESCCECPVDGFNPSSLPSLYLSIIVLFLLPIPSPNVGGAVNDGGRKAKCAGGGSGCSCVVWRGRSGVRIASAIVLPPCDSPASLGEGGGVSGINCKLSSSSTAPCALSLARSARSASSAPVRPRASALPWLFRCTTRRLGQGQDVEESLEWAGQISRRGGGGACRQCRIAGATRVPPPV